MNFFLFKYFHSNSYVYFDKKMAVEFNCRRRLSEKYVRTNEKDLPELVCSDFEQTSEAMEMLMEVNDSISKGRTLVSISDLVHRDVIVNIKKRRP